MKYLVILIRWLTGGLFVFSGLIKVNDPVGTSIKLVEYFDVFTADTGIPFNALQDYTLLLAVFLVVLEVALGVALLIGFRPKLTLSLLMAMIVFFTFLTFYSAYFNKVTDCGCFGDAIKLTPWESFYKDIVLLVFIGFLLLNFKHIHIPENQGSRTLAIIMTVLLSTSFAYYAIEHLPFIDFRAYKIGTHIPSAMEPSATLEYLYVMEKNGKQEVFDQYPSDESYAFVEMKLKNPEAQPKITDYNIWRGAEDYTKSTLEGKKLLIIVTKASKANRKSLRAAANRAPTLAAGGVTSIVISSSEEADLLALIAAEGLNVPYFFGDATVLKTMIRSNPGFILLDEGKVLAKYHYNDLPSDVEILRRYE
jgi:uncharacterized membrane protein YphA (DoxX/SURF4 family)